MHLVTLMDYTDPLPVLMCKVWIYLARRAYPDGEITILHGDRFEKLKPFARRHRIRCEHISTEGIPTAEEWSKLSEPEAHFPPMRLTISVWAAFERLGFTKFLFVEPDAFILERPALLEKAAETKPFIGVAERARWNFVAPYMNNGVYTYNSTDGFLTYAKLLKFWEDSGRKIPVPVGDQGLINAYLHSIGYSPFHSQVGIEFNCLGANCMVIRADDGGLLVYSGSRPSFGECGFEFTNWIGWDQALPVKILHFFGPTWKPWQVPSARRLLDYLGRKVAEIEAS